MPDSPVTATLTPTGRPSGSVVLKASWPRARIAGWYVSVTDAEGTVPVTLGRDDAATRVYVMKPSVRLVLPEPSGPYWLHVEGHEPLKVELDRIAGGGEP